MFRDVTLQIGTFFPMSRRNCVEAEQWTEISEIRSLWQ